MSDIYVTEDLRLFRILFDQMPQLGWTARAMRFQAWVDAAGGRLTHQSGAIQNEDRCRPMLDRERLFSRQAGRKLPSRRSGPS